MKPLLLFRFFIVLLYFFFLFTISKLFFWNYEEFIDWVVTILGRSDLEMKVRGVIGKTAFTQLRFAAIIAAVFLTLGSVLSFVNAEKIVGTITSFLVRINQSIRQFLFEIKNTPILFRGIFLLISLLYLIKAYWYVFYWPMQYDEAWTFNYFISKSWIVPFTAPHNNHILYTILAKLSHHIFFFLKPIHAIRLPLPLFGLLSGFVLFKYVKLKWDRNMALLAFGVFLSCGPIVFYALYARAYMVAIFFCLVYLYSFTVFLQRGSTFHQALLIFSAVLAVYSIPTSVYFLFPVSVIFAGSTFFKNQSLVKPLFFSALLIVFGILLLYAPFIISTKMSWLVDGLKNSSSFNSLEVWNTHKKQTGVFFTSLRAVKHWIFWFVLAFSLFAALFVKKNKREFILILFSLLTPFLVMVLQQKFIFTRVFSYNAIFYSILISFFLWRVMKKLQAVSVNQYVAFIWFVFFSYMAHHHPFFNWSNTWDNTVKEAFNFLQEKEIDETYDFFFYSKPALEYFSFEKNHPLTVIMPQETSISYREFDEKKWESVIWWKEFKGERPDLSAYKEVWQKDSLLILVPKE